MFRGHVERNDYNNGLSSCLTGRADLVYTFIHGLHGVIGLQPRGLEIVGEWT